jgi:hypothetical protein
MRKIFHFDSADAPYIADAAVLCCFDYRISTAVRKFLKKQNIERSDMIVVAGGAKTLASPRNDFEQDFILEQVRMSIRLHQSKRVLRDLLRPGVLQRRSRRRSRAPSRRTAARRRTCECELRWRLRRAVLCEVRWGLGNKGGKGLEAAARPCFRVNPAIPCTLACISHLAYYEKPRG